MASSFLDQYESLDVIGNGSFGIIRKVRRKSDGMVFARKELNFERMNERDRKQIVSEVNILKDLHHDHIVQYYDRFVDRDAGILYILMEYCGGGDLSTVIKQAEKQKRPIPEDTIWSYFLQILLALHYCHHPHGHGRTGSGSLNSASAGDTETTSRRAQILHRDIKPDNIFLDENNRVKLGDFGLSKALPQASFANTYVGTPYYMSPELMQEKAYDSKSDIWSLGCLIYELCALKPPFHEAKTHSELSIFIRNCRIPPLPKGYSTALATVIKNMLSLNPAMRPSAAQLLQHERIEFIYRVNEAEKLMTTVRAHRSAVIAKEQEIHAKEVLLAQKEKQLSSALLQKDNEIFMLRADLAQLQDHRGASQKDIDAAVKIAIARREDELRVLVMKREEEVAAAMAKREEEIMEAVRKREQEICDAWMKQEQKIREEVEGQYKILEERIELVNKRELDLRTQEEQLESARQELETRIKRLEQSAKGRKEKVPLEEVKNVLAQATPVQRRTRFDPLPTPRPSAALISSLETPVSRATFDDTMASAMKGVVFTSTGESLQTPVPNELVKLFNCSPKVGLNFAKIFDFEEGDGDVTFQQHSPTASSLSVLSPPPSPSTRRDRERARESDSDRQSSPPPTRIRRPSIRSATRVTRTESAPLATTDTTNRANLQSAAKPLPHPHLRPSRSSGNITRATTLPQIPVPRTHPSPEYDFTDEENLPSPFLKRIDRTAAAKNALNSATPATSTSSSIPSAPSSSSLVPTSSMKAKRRGSSGLTLRAVAAANSTRKLRPGPGPQEEETTSFTPASSEYPEQSRISLASARKANEEAKKALSRS